ncbi:hypothetical protein E2C01_024140 [Portunus trituberculatus]|uniref:Uncharacterized protein n=1 Tax=Portunus trituberculatus TaxID=210409 RepID=A0A5B7EBX1_PORTR|nr:hypothetical protein [Portunus trituberculatus]
MNDTVSSTILTSVIFTILPLILAICTTALPTAPAAPFTSTVSPALGLQMSSSPKYAVFLRKIAHFWHRLYGELVLFDVLSCEQGVGAPALVVNQVSAHGPLRILALNDSVEGSQ